MTEALRIDHRLTIPADELSETFVRASGPGGQNVNKVSSAVQLRFAAGRSSVLSSRHRARLLRLAGARTTQHGDILIESTRTRSQARNREDARSRLRDLILEAVAPPPPPRRQTRPTRGSVERRLKAKAGRAGIKAARRRPELD